MPDKSDAELVADYLREIGETPDGLDVKKFYDRATMLDSENHHGKIAFSLERHRAICGARYSKGLPLAAFETYWPIYYFDPSEPSLTINGESKPPAITINVIALVESQTDQDFIDFNIQPRFLLIRRFCAKSVSNEKPPQVQGGQ